ncbi:MAG TPA: phosphoribosyltransferase family protein [Methylophilaceae bacterium]|nr:phosphoribosyltransferase family protein [Methylophilaceae bacterium]
MPTAGNMHIMFFNDRIDAAVLLAQKLARYKNKNPLILAIPRGAVPMAKVIADKLNGDLDVVLVSKLPAPMNPEFAIGAIAENGWTHIADWAADTGATPEYIEEQKKAQLEKMRQRRKQYTALLEPIDCRDRITIVVDDGLATGATMITALHSLRKMEPKELVVAVPVSSPTALAEVEKYADTVIFLLAPMFFRAVGQFYAEFPQVSDKEVMETLAAKRDKTQSERKE